MRLPLESRSGNMVLLGVCSLAALASMTLFAFSLVKWWEVARLTDRAFQTILLLNGIVSALLAAGAAFNLQRPYISPRRPRIQKQQQGTT
jgi:hypothetical protein